jgi:hypothetical protein
MAQAIEDRQNEDPGWRVHSFVASDVEDHQHGVPLELEVQIMRVTRFVLIMEREIQDPNFHLGPKAV